MSKSQKIILAIALIIVCGLSVFILIQTIHNSNSTFVLNISSISNVILAGLTLIYVYLTYLILVSNNQTLKEKNRPYVIVSLPYWYYRLELKVENIGNRPAKNVTISFSPDLSTMFIANESYRETYKNMFAQKFMPPGFEVSDMLGTSFDTMNKEKKEREIQFDVSYEDLEGNTYSHSYEVHVHNYLYENKIVSWDERYYLKQIASTLEKIEKIMSKKID